MWAQISSCDDRFRGFHSEHRIGFPQVYLVSNYPHNPNRSNNLTLITIHLLISSSNPNDPDNPNKPNHLNCQSFMIIIDNL